MRITNRYKLSIYLYVVRCIRGGWSGALVIGRTAAEPQA
jgi:hypothetical protein